MKHNRKSPSALHVIACVVILAPVTFSTLTGQTQSETLQNLPVSPDIRPISSLDATKNTIINLKLENTTISDAARRIANLAHVSLHLDESPALNLIVTKSFQNATAFDAFRYLAGQADMVVVWKDDVVSFVAGQPFSPDVMKAISVRSGVAQAVAETKHISLDLKHVTFADALKTVEKLADVKIHVAEALKNSDRRITIYSNDVSANDALKMIATTGHLKITFKDDGAYVESGN
jgi:hypothetical protein